MESIQLAQMLADLTDLEVAQGAQAAVALVNANKALPTDTTPGPSPTSAPLSKSTDSAMARPDLKNHQRVSSASSIISRAASPAKFDKFGRRILTPPMSRTNSTQGSIPGTPRREAEHLEDDVEKATSLMALYEIRSKLREQQDNTQLLKWREKIAALQARQQAEKNEGSSADGRASRYTYPKAPA